MANDQTGDDGLLDAAALCQMFEESEDASMNARKLAERDRDYVDNIQLTAEEIAVLGKRKQPPVIINRIKRKVDFLKGYEMGQRVDPRALPRTPKHEDDANSIEQALRYVAEQQDFDQIRSRVWDNLLVEGSGGYRVGVKESADAIEVTLNRVPWDRMFADPHSSEPDYSDARYVGLVRWEDRDEALAQYSDNPDADDILTDTLNSASISDTYDDKPKFRVWADKKRRRVRICQIWVKRRDKWFFAEYTKGGILRAGPSPHVTDKGESDGELIFGSAYVNRDGERYGLIREMIGPQDEINKRRSKSLHLLNTNQIITEEGAIDVEVVRREAARPDGVIQVPPGSLDKVKIETRLDLAQGHMQLLQEAKNEIDMMAGNIALQGNALQRSAASGKAIIASQQGGAMEIAPLMDALRHLDIRVFRAIWYRIRQYWTAEKWIRITDDERNIKWVGLNVDPREFEMRAAMNPAMAGQVQGVVGNLSELDCDIIIDDAPDGLTPQLEQFQALVELKKMDANGELPFRAILTAMPNLKNKQQVLAMMDEGQQPSPQQQMAQEIQVRGAVAKVQETEANAMLKQAQAQAALRPDQAQAPEQGPTEAEMMDTLASAEQKRSAAVLNYARAEQAQVETLLAPQQMRAQAEAARMKAQQPRTAAR